MRSSVAFGALVFAVLGCAGEAAPHAPPPRRGVEASAFVCSGETCTQRHVRLPDDGEWRCAERDGVVWCAGGEPAAGVVSGSSGRGYRCGERRGTRRERVCIDATPDYPDGGARAFRCRFEQERGIVRTCARAPSTLRPPRPGVAANCWVDADCSAGCRSRHVRGVRLMGRAVVFVLPWFLVAIGCARSKAADFWLLLAVASDSGVRLAEAVVSPPEALVERRVDNAGVALLLRRDLGAVRVSAPGACPLVIDAFRAPNPLEARIEPLFDLGPAVRVVGPERRFELRGVERCAEAKRVTLDFRIERGAPLADVRIEDGGRAFSATTRGVEGVRDRATWGIVPVSARERGAAKIEVTGRVLGGASFERTLEVAALSRSSGLPSVALGHGVLLAGRGFRLEKKPEGSRAELRSWADTAELVPDVTGDYALADVQGRTLVVQSARYDEMPLDCGRSDCHAAVSAHARESPMTRAFEVNLGGRRPLKSPECAVACHTTGEPGTNDGGFSHVFEELGLAALPHDFAELPRALRRLGGVGCLACHGPSRVPPDSARWAVLRSDVCATCHDAPPRYGHVAAFATTSMARADHDPRTRDTACARCHTTWGSRGEAARRPPAEVGALGIGCVACHDVHGDRPLRPTSDVCIECHSPSAGERTLPEASAAAVWAGRGGSDVSTGAPLEGPAPHASDARGCLRCHDSGPSELERGKGHAFRANSESCAPCHAEAPKRRPELAARARAIVDAILPHARKSSPPHAEPFTNTLVPAKARALKNALLVLEDPAADVHNPVYAERLLAEERP